LCIGVDLLVVADVGSNARRLESVMRHFLALALAPQVLASGMMEAAPQRLLVALPGRSHALTPRLTRARIGTVPLPVITAPAHP
jgi:hypothetical protein